MDNFLIGIQSLVAYHCEVYWDHFYLYYILMIWHLADMDTGDNRTDIYLFADDAKICRHITCTDDYQILQDTVDRIQHWSDVWLLKLNVTT